MKDDPARMMTKTPTGATRRDLVKLGGSVATLTAMGAQAGLVPRALLLTGEVTASSAILFARLGDRARRQGWKKVFGSLRFRVTSSEGSVAYSDFLEARSSNDYTIRARIKKLSPHTDYSVELVGKDVIGEGTFRTLGDPEGQDLVRFVMFSCMNFEKFFGLGRNDTQYGSENAASAATGYRASRGYPVFDVIRQRNPDFFVGNGDNVYYDHPAERPELHARSCNEMREKWHRQFSVPSLNDFVTTTSGFWMKDDHDYRFNDADREYHGGRKPSHDDGVRVFREQLPVVEDVDGEEPTYRTRRLNRDVQIWFLEGRDYRSPNSAPDEAGKSIWGREQYNWLVQSMAKSTARHLLVVSPTPMIGPDDAYKRDNHCNAGGFRHERDRFFSFLEANGLASKTVILNGDRHWQYHSIHPSGIHEVCCGASNGQNARRGRAPGDSKSTDPSGLINQPFLQPEPTGGFLYVTVQSHGPCKSCMQFIWISENGDVLHSASKT